MLTAPKPSRRLLLLALDWVKAKDPPISLGQASIYAHLAANNIDVIPRSWAVNSPSFNPRAVSEFIIQQMKDDVDLALGVYVWNEEAIQSILKNIRGAFRGKIILGGPQISYVKKKLEHYYPEADVFIRGHAEQALVELMQTSQAEETSNIKGVHYAGTKDKMTSASAQLASLSSPFLTGLIKPQSFLRWETQRGCPFHCSFCQHKEPQQLKDRYFGLERIIEEAKWIANNPIIKDVHVVDPTFNSGPNYLEVLRTLRQSLFRGKIALQTRIEMVKPEFLDEVQELNKTAQVVLEFGLQTIHPEEQKIIERPNNLKKISKILGEIKERKILSEVSLIFGLPNQTVQSFKETILFCQKHEVPIIRAFPLMLLRGTPLHDKKNTLRLIESHEIADEKIDRIQDGISHVVSSPSFSYEEWKEMAKIAGELEKMNEVYLSKKKKFLSPNESAVSPLQKHSIFLSQFKESPSNRGCLLTNNKNGIE